MIEGETSIYVLYKGWEAGDIFLYEVSLAFSPLGDDVPVFMPRSVHLESWLGGPAKHQHWYSRQYNSHPGNSCKVTPRPPKLARLLEHA